MRAWERPEICSVPGESSAPWLHDTKTDSLVLAQPLDVARLYVCGITPYDATHIGHANTYLAFDTLQRVWIDAGFHVHYAQNVTDVDDPLLERASSTGVNWRDLAQSQVELFRADMEALGIIPPHVFVAVTEVIDEVADAVAILQAAGLAYSVPTDDAIAGSDCTIATDLYFDISAAETSSGLSLGDESNLDRASMVRLFAERGGDPDRAGKRDQLDPLVWRAARSGEPAWESSVGAGRPGWHIECSVIALKELGTDFTVQGGGSDLIFPHHDMSAGHAQALSGHPLAGVYSHTGMVAYHGEKMSKSLGNLVLVSGLRAQNIDPRAIRLALLSRHYRSDWEWTEAILDQAVERLSVWSAAYGEGSVRAASGATPPSNPPSTPPVDPATLEVADIFPDSAVPDSAMPDSAVPDSAVPASTGTASTGTAAAVVESVRLALRHDLDTPEALQLIDDAAGRVLDDPTLVKRAISALLGVTL